MRLSKGVLYAGLAFAVCALSTPAKAGGITVISDQGSGLADATGLFSGAAVKSETGAMITDVNGAAVTGLSLQVGQVIVSSFMSMPGVDVITGGVGTKTISDGTTKIQLELTITGGFADTGTLEIFSKITSVFGAPNVVGGYNFATLVGGTMVLTDSSPGFDFTTLIGHEGVTNTGGNLSVLEMSTIPEPTSLALLGIGMAGFFTYRRLFKRTATA